MTLIQRVILITVGEGSWKLRGKEKGGGCVVWHMVASGLEEFGDNPLGEANALLFLSKWFFFFFF